MPRKARKTRFIEFVLDGSLALAWYFKDEANPYADAVAAGFPSSRAVVPAIWPLEIADAVVTGERRKRSTEAQAARWLGYQGSLPIVIDDETNHRAWSDIVALARAHQLSAHDASLLGTGPPAGPTPRQSRREAQDSSLDSRCTDVRPLARRLAN